MISKLVANRIILLTTCPHSNILRDTNVRHHRKGACAMASRSRRPQNSSNREAPPIGAPANRRHRSVSACPRAGAGDPLSVTPASPTGSPLPFPPFPSCHARRDGKRLTFPSARADRFPARRSLPSCANPCRRSVAGTVERSESGVSRLFGVEMPIAPPEEFSRRFGVLIATNMNFGNPAVAGARYRFSPRNRLPNVFSATAHAEIGRSFPISRDRG